VRLVSLAAQQFVSDVAAEALDVAKQRGAAGTKDKRERGIPEGGGAAGGAGAPGAAGGSSKKERRYVLTSEDLAEALSGKGVRIAKPPYFAQGGAPQGGAGGAGGAAGR
jgi:hypothetical protein